jgi:3-hydroxyisobutyrate dehydrogenase-like beta-hydroxyacid dehydrogenase
MGSAMTERWIDAGIEVFGYDIDDQQVEAFRRLGGHAENSASSLAARRRYGIFHQPSPSEVNLQPWPDGAGGE